MQLTVRYLRLNAVVLVALLLGMADMVEAQKAGIHVIYMEPNGPDAENYSDPASGIWLFGQDVTLGLDLRVSRKGFGYAFAPILALGVASEINNDNNAWIDAAIFTTAAGIPLGLIGGALGAAENIKKNSPVNGIHESFRNRIPYWRKCARYKQKTSDTLP